MAIGFVEMQGSIARTQDFGILKQHEDNKEALDQSNFQSQFHKEVDSKATSISESNGTQKDTRQFDAKEKGDNEYSGNGGQQKKKRPPQDGIVRLKGTGGFDMKI